MSKCQCTQPGHCPVFKRLIVGRLWQICQGIDCPPQLTEAYRLLWEASPPSPARPRGPCRKLGEPTGELVECPTCAGRVQIKVLGCAVHGRCTVSRSLDGIACCAACPEYQPADEPCQTACP